MEIKVLIIDDSALVRQTLATILENDSLIKVTGTAQDPIAGVRLIQAQRPDVIISGIEMARMDGLTFLRKINETIDPIPTVICSSLVSKNSPEALKAKELGASEIFFRPASGTKKFLEDSAEKLCATIKSAYNKGQGIQTAQSDSTQSDSNSAYLQPIENSSPPDIPSPQDSLRHTIQPKLNADVVLAKPDPKFAPVNFTEPVVVIGASTGGTEALKDYLTELPPDSPGIVIVQHMPEHFTESFANRLNGLCKITVREAKNGDKVESGTALIAPGNHHLLLKRTGTFYSVEVCDGPLVCRHRPSVDVLFRSAAKVAGKNAIGIIMTGMGDDGSHGMKEMHDCGSYNLAQDEESSIVWGMPGEAVKAGAVDKILSLQNLPAATINRAKIMQMHFNHTNSR